MDLEDFVITGEIVKMNELMQDSSSFPGGRSTVLSISTSTIIPRSNALISSMVSLLHYHKSNHFTINVIFDSFTFSCAVGTPIFIARRAFKYALKKLLAA